MKIWKRWVAVALAVALIGTGNTKAATTAYQLSVPIGVSEESVIVTFGDNVFEVNTNEDGNILVMTEKEEGFLYVEVNQALWKYHFNQGTIIGKEEIAPAILSFTGNVDLKPGDTLWLRVNAEAVVSSAELSYQWYKDSVPLSGKNSAVLSIKNVAASDSGNYSVEVSQVGSHGVVTRSSEQVVSVSDSEDSIQGLLCYNVGVNETLVLENYSSSGAELTYSIVREEETEEQQQEEQSNSATTIDCSLEGNKFVAQEEGVAILTVSDGVTTKLIHISCNNETWIMDGISTDFEYDGRQHPFVFVGAAGIQSCIPQYWREGEDWSYEAPVVAGDYVCRLDIVDERNQSFCKFVPMSVSRKEVSVFNPVVKTKEYDGTTEAEVTGTLIGTISGDNVKVVFPTATFSKADAGERAVRVDGGVRLAGADADNYRLKEFALTDLTGTILKKTITVTAISKFSTEGEEPVTLTYTTSRNAGAIEGLGLQCSVTKDSAPGEYPIKVIAPKSKNYNYKCKDGTYVVLARETEFGEEDSLPSDDDFTTESTVYDHYLTDPEDEYDWEEWENWVEQPEVTDPDEENQEPEADGELEEEEESQKVLVNLFDISRGILLDGLYKLDNASLDANKNVLVLKYWVSRTGVLTASDGVRVRKGATGAWKKKLNFAEDFNGDYASAENFNFYAKCGDKVVRCRINKFICDRVAPDVSVDGIGLSSEEKSTDSVGFNYTLSIQVKAVYGAAGGKALSYKLVTEEIAGVDSEDGWKLISGNTITVDQEFEGKIAIKAENALGNRTVVYTESFCIDTAAPVVEGIEFGGVYQDSVTYNVVDKSGVQSVLFDGKEVGTSGTILGGGIHTLIVTDVNGNSQSITFTCEDGNIVNKVLHHFKSLQ